MQTDTQREPEQVGSTSCAGCGRAGVGAVVVLPDGEHWADDGEENGR